MTDLPNKDYLTEGDATEAQFQSAIGDLYDVVSELGLIGPGETIEIASGTIVPTKGLVFVDTESLGPSDNLDFITPSTIGSKVIFVRAVSAARPVTLRHNQSGSGKLFLNGGANLILADPSYLVALFWNATSSLWEEVWRNFGLYVTTDAEKTAIKTLLSLGTAASKDTGTSAGQVPLNSNLGSAAYLTAGSESGQVPTNGLLGALAYLATVPNSRLDAIGTPGTYNQVETNAQGRVVAGSNVPSVAAASQAEVEAVTETLKYVSPATQHFHPAMPKAVGYATVTSTGTLTVHMSYGCTITGLGSGGLRITFTNAFGHTNYAVLFNVESGASADIQNRLSTRVDINGAGGTRVINFAIYGDLP